MATRSVEARRGGPRRSNVRWTTAIAALAVALSFSPARSLELTVADAAIGPNETVSIPIRATEAKGLGALDMRFVFDGDAFEVTDVSGGSVLSNALVDFKANKYNCVIAFASSDPVDRDGDLLIVKMRRRPGAAAGTIMLPEAVRAWTGAGGQPIRVSLRPGHVAPLPQSIGFDWRLAAGAIAALLVASFVAGGVLAARTRGAPSSQPKAPPPIPHAATPHAFEPPEPRLQQASAPEPDHRPKFCAQCGVALAPSANFCPGCGTQISHG